jgi:hypothetical protein
LAYEVSFSETALGRLLLATELYILVVSSMIFSFYMREVTANTLPRSHGKRTSSFRGLRGTIYDNGLGLVGEDGANPVGQGQSSPSWLSWNALQRHSGQTRASYGDGRRPRAEENSEAERGVNSPEERGLSIPEDIPPSSLNSSTMYPIAQGISEGFSSPTIRLPSDSVNDNGKPSTPTAAALATAPDSPTLPLDGTSRETREREINRPSSREKPTSDGSIISSQLSGFDNLLRERDELDRSIAAVRAMFVPGRSGELPRGASPDTVSDHRSRFRESSTTAYGPTSASGRSEFSLSVFPEPPQVPMIAENLRRSALRSSTVPAPTPTRSTFSIGEQALPVSTAEGDNVAISASARRTESAATHYDVTSFIGGVSIMVFPFETFAPELLAIDLTSPDLGSAAQIARYLKYSDTDSETEDSIDLATIVTVQRRPSSGVIARPQVVEKSSLIPDVPVSASASTPAQPPDRSARHPPPRQPSPPPSTSARAPSARPSVTPTGRVGLPPRPKLDDSRRGDQQMRKGPPSQHR